MVYDYEVEVREQGCLLKTFRAENVTDGLEAVAVVEAKILAWNPDLEPKRFFIVEGKEKNGDPILREVLWTGLELFARRVTTMDGRDLTIN